MNILCIGTHPDDIEIGCGGTMARYIQQGHDVHALIVTRGEHGSIEMEPAVLAAVREEEARTAAGVLGIASVEFLDQVDGYTMIAQELRVRLISIIRSLKPTLIFTHSKGDASPDHRLTADLCDDAIRAAAGPWFYTAGGAPHRVEGVYGYEVWTPLARPQMFQEVDDTIDLKLRALSCYKSQIKDIAYDDAIRGLNRYRGVMSGRGTYAEAFEVWSSISR